MELKFSLYLEMSQNPKVIMPYIQSRLHKRMETIRDRKLKDDYRDAIEELSHIIENERFINVAYRKALRHYEITRDHMESQARKDDDYMRSLNHTKCLDDLFVFASALEAMSLGKVPNLETLI